jgi:hypothetical protein
VERGVVLFTKCNSSSRSATLSTSLDCQEREDLTWLVSGRVLGPVIPVCLLIVFVEGLAVLILYILDRSFSVSY